MDKRCVLCQMLYERFYDSNLFRLGCISENDYKDILFDRFSKIMDIPREDNYYFFDSLRKCILGYKDIKEIMSIDELNIRVENIIKRCINLFLKLHGVFEDKMFTNTHISYYKKDSFIIDSEDDSINAFLKLICVDKIKVNDNGKYYYFIDPRTLTKEKMDVFEIIK